MAKIKRFKKASDIRMAGVGFGCMTEFHHFVEGGKAGMVPVAVCEPDDKRRAGAEKAFPGIKTFKTPEEMYKGADFDLVVVATPHDSHCKLVCQALNKGKHVMCEKPLAITTEECDKMIATAKKNDVMLTAYHNRHWDDLPRQMMKLLNDGAVGEILRVRASLSMFANPGKVWGGGWRLSKSISGGVMYDWGVHVIEWAMQAMDISGAKATEVSGFTHEGFWSDETPWKKDTIEDDSYAVVRFDTGQSLTLSFSWLDATPGDGLVEIHGTKGTLQMNFGEYKLILPGKKGQTVRTGPNMPMDWDKLYQNVADHLVKGEKLVITAERARRMVHLLDLATKSGKLNKTLPVKYGDDS